MRLLCTWRQAHPVDLGLFSYKRKVGWLMWRKCNISNNVLLLLLLHGRTLLKGNSSHNRLETTASHSAWTIFSFYDISPPFILLCWLVVFPLAGEWWFKVQILFNCYSTLSNKRNVTFVNFWKKIAPWRAYSIHAFYYCYYIKLFCYLVKSAYLIHVFY